MKKVLLFILVTAAAFALLVCPAVAAFHANPNFIADPSIPVDAQEDEIVWKVGPGDAN